MGIISGILSLICFCLLSLKAVTARIHLKRADSVLRKLHKPVSALLLVLCFFHMLFVFSVLKSRNMLVVISGAAGVLLLFLLICLCHLIKDRKKKMWWHRALTVFMAVCLVGHVAGYLADFREYQRRIAEITFADVNLEEIEDGIYEGECDAGYIYARVKVEISGGRIVSLQLLEHRNERGASAESVIDAVQAEQKIDVDAVSGATNSSKVIKKAIENAVSGVD